MTVNYDQNLINQNWEHLDSKINVHPLLIQRISEAAFAEEPIDKQKIIQLLQAARCAPSFHNNQPWHFIIVNDGPPRELINQTLIEGNSTWAAEAPTLLAVLVNRKSKSSFNQIDYAMFDVGLAVQNILLQATHLGLAAHPVNYFQTESAKHDLKVPEAYDLILFIALGYPSDEIVNTEACRLRKPLADIATWENWGGESVSG